MTQQHNDTQTETVKSTVTYTIDPDGISLTGDLAIHKEVGDSHCDYVLVGSNPDDGSETIAFGFHKDEMFAKRVATLNDRD